MIPAGGHSSMRALLAAILLVRSGPAAWWRWRWSNSGCGHGCTVAAFVVLMYDWGKQNYERIVDILIVFPALTFGQEVGRFIAEVANSLRIVWQVELIWVSEFPHQQNDVEIQFVCGRGNTGPWWPFSISVCVPCVSIFTPSKSKLCWLS
jgi:hypothetical protein